VVAAVEATEALPKAGLPGVRHLRAMAAELAKSQGLDCRCVLDSVARRGATGGSWGL
jgi:hypothetical protein